MNQDTDKTVVAEDDIEAMLNQDLDDIPDLADFVVPKEGVYAVNVKDVDTTKEVGDSRCIEIKYKITELLEQGNSPLGDDCKVGDEFTQLYFLTTAKGIAFNKSSVERFVVSGTRAIWNSNLAQTLEDLKVVTLPSSLSIGKTRSLLRIKSCMLM